MSITDIATDTITKKITGRDVKTTIISIEEMQNLLDTVLNSVEKDEIDKIKKVIKGSFWNSLHMYDTLNQKYRVSTLYAGTIASNRLINEFSIMDFDTNIIYTCKSFLFKRKIKKHVKRYSIGIKYKITYEPLKQRMCPSCTLH